MDPIYKTIPILRCFIHPNLIFLISATKSQNMLHGMIPNVLDELASIPCAYDKRVAFSKFPVLPASTEAVCSFCLCGDVQLKVKQRINPVSLFSDMMTGTVTFYKSCQNPKCVLKPVGSPTYFTWVYSAYGFKDGCKCIPNLGDQKSVIWRPSRKAYQCCTDLGFTIINTNGEIGAMCCTANQGRIGKSRERLARNWSELPWDNCSVEPLKFLPVADAERFRTAISCAHEVGFLNTSFNDMLEAMQDELPAL